MALLVEYDGTRYHGFQVQQNASTVQGTLEAALEQLIGERAPLHGASRTDTGVHALGQVVSFRTGADYAPETFVLALNYYLPEDIAVRSACELAPEVDVRRHALSRTYRYSIKNQGTPSPLTRAQALWIGEALDVEAMDGAAQALLGRHDFASFSGPLTYPQQSTVRGVLAARVWREGPMVYFDMGAEAFLPQQVRRTMAQLIRIGKGRAGVEVIRDPLEHPVLGAAWEAVSPHGLCLQEITYPTGLAPFAGERAMAYTPAVAGAVFSGA